MSMIESMDYATQRYTEEWWAWYRSERAELIYCRKQNRSRKVLKALRRLDRLAVRGMVRYAVNEAIQLLREKHRKPHGMASS